MSPREENSSPRVRRRFGTGAIIAWAVLALLTALMLAGLGGLVISDPSPGNDRVWGWCAIVSGALIAAGALGLTMKRFFRHAASRRFSVACLAAGTGCCTYLVISALGQAREASGDFAAFAAMGSAILAGIVFVAGCIAVAGIVLLLRRKSR